MKPKLIALNIVLVAALGALAWQTRIQLHEARLKRESTIHVQTKPAPIAPAIPAPKPEAPTAVKYADVATKNLFAKDRNPNVIVDPPKVDPPKKMPPLPVVYGVLGLPGGTRAIMAEKSGLASVPVRAGDAIGQFKIASLDPQTVIFDWDGERIPKKIDDLIDRSNSSPPAATVNAPPPAANAAPPPPRPANPQPAPTGPGAEVPNGAGPSQRSCVPGDTSPPNSVVDGYRKNVVPTPFGNICSWIKVQ